MSLNYNNPGNIRKNIGTIWQGAIYPGSSNSFVTFISPAYGYRALFKVLITDIYQGQNTISKIIYDYAPPSDNNPTNAYVNFVSDRTGIPANEVISVSDSDSLYRIGKEIARFETGTTPIESDIQEGFALAFGNSPVITPSNQFPTNNAWKGALVTAALLLYLSEG